MNQSATIRCNMSGYYWQPSSLGELMPKTALKGGIDIDGKDIYVGRAMHNDELLPAKVIPDSYKCCVSYEGKEYEKYEYEVLCGENFVWKWKRLISGHIKHHGAVLGGVSVNREPLYIGRILYNGSIVVGKIHLSRGVCFIPFGGSEYSSTDYEVLIHLGWRKD